MSDYYAINEHISFLFSVSFRSTVYIDLGGSNVISTTILLTYLYDRRGGQTLCSNLMSLINYILKLMHCQ